MKSLPEAVQVEAKATKPVVFWGQVSTVHEVHHAGIALGLPCKYI